jgi:hypothetical protein
VILEIAEILLATRLNAGDFGASCSGPCCLSHSRSPSRSSLAGFGYEARLLPAAAYSCRRHYRQCPQERRKPRGFGAFAVPPRGFEACTATPENSSTAAHVALLSGNSAHRTTARERRKPLQNGAHSQSAVSHRRVLVDRYCGPTGHSDAWAMRAAHSNDLDWTLNELGLSAAVAFCERQKRSVLVLADRALDHSPRDRES